MPEEQGVWANAWNQRLNFFLQSVLHWDQLGQSNVDVYCQGMQQPVGLDSVFGYKHNPQSAQQIVVVEAKTVEKLNNISKGKVDTWVGDFLAKLQCVPYAKDFHEKFQPEMNAQYGIGLIALWVRNVQDYRHEQLQRWLAQLSVPKVRNNPPTIGFVSNRAIARMCAIHRTIESLTNGNDYESIKYFFPFYGSQPKADGSCVPIEAFLSKFVFCNALKRQPLRGEKDKFDKYQAAIVFYLGEVSDYDDLHFIGLALKQFQLLSFPEIEIYLLRDPHELRNQIEAFKRENGSSSVQINFRWLSASDELPSWLSQK